eukprot:TRINITY_DN975_c0_g1_i2.p1 TRINITY_DN975_c0_g1~~TRINITY_DN975_c0_g1_i2.p1  ORF type:complete len:249 (-),score=39.15 TRINITY_DN975_c0_g1_i2:112-858(-)
MKMRYNLCVFLNHEGNKIAVIENLGVTQDQYDTIDLSDNEIKKLENFPLLRRLRTIFLNNNRINRILPNLDEVLPNLDTLILTNNRFAKLSDLEPLADLISLRSLSLLENPVTKKQNYRLYIIHLLPNLRLLDFRKIKQKEKLESIKQFGEPQTRVKKQKVVVAGDSAELLPKLPQAEYSQEQVSAIKAAIDKTSTMDDLYRIENALMAGQIPQDISSQQVSESVSMEVENSVSYDSQYLNDNIQARS